ncbi:hypothetical protein EHQ53_17665 [Leptospira langatensis]|uniref:Lipoprotein n=1 Tax=Leptospira langatensis TaxID=2484983 RepID=A0A5F1ZR93_9LEPT|nr:hypothetical protein [Leptospira langatensis]TGK05460.1 hypothetical protein EHO57_01905 [Leptospira langatensis]TGL38596.1 hypothetical protein EHQ53_17665 [Leptospira langatensis]
MKNGIRITIILLLSFLSACTADSELPNQFPPRQIFPRIEYKLVRPTAYTKQIFYPMLDKNGETLLNHWISSPITWEDGQLFRKTLDSDLKGKNGTPDSPNIAKVSAIPVGSLLTDEKGGLLEFLVLVDYNKIKCQDRFTVQISTVSRGSEEMSKILWMGAAHRLPYSVEKCLNNDDPHIKNLARLSFYPSFAAFPWTYISNLFTTQPQFLTVNYFSTLQEGIAKLPDTIRYSFCARTSNAPSGAVRCVAFQTNTTPPILWKEHIRNASLADLTKEAENEPAF